MTKDELEILSTSTNAVVLRTRGRQFPGILIQGDSLKIMTDLANDVASLCSELGKPEIADAAGELRDLLGGYLNAYEQVLMEHNKPLPYQK